MTQTSPFERALGRLREQHKTVVGDLSPLEREAADQLARHLVDCLRIAADNAAGCLLLAEHRLGAPLVTVTRSIFESTITTYWATLDTATGRSVLEFSRDEGFRLMRNLLTGQIGAVVHKTTGQDFTQQFLKSSELTRVKRPPRFDVMARNAGIKRLYDTF